MKVKCPGCKKDTEFAPSNTFRPFCSERCQMIDLGAWADEQYKVPVSVQDPDSVNEKSLSESGVDDAAPPKDDMN